MNKTGVKSQRIHALSDERMFARNMGNTRSKGTALTNQSWLIWALAGILALALGLRVWGIDFGLPYELTTDEGKEIHRALKLGVGEYYWGFGKGGLYYILFVEYAVLYLFWWMLGRVGDTHDFALQIIRDPSMIFLFGRLTVAFMGALTCLVAFHIGKRTYDWRIGLGAAFIGATAYAHAAHSHIINVDIGMTLAVWASILAYLQYEKTGNQRRLIGAGVLAGLAIAFKLPGAIILLALFMAIGTRSENWNYPSRTLKETAIVVITCLMTLTIVAPEWIIDGASKFGPYAWIIRGDVTPTGTFEGDMKEAFHLVTTRRSSNWSGYFRMLLSDHNLALTISGVVGVVLGLMRRERWPLTWGVLILLFIAVISAAPRAQPEYYLLPIMPAMWLLSSKAMAALAGRHRSLFAAGVACVSIVPLLAIVRQNVEWTRPDTREIAKEWIETNIGPGSKILMDGFQYRFVPSPPLRPDVSAIHRQIAGVSEEGNDYRGVSPRTLKLYAEAMSSLDGPTYELHSTQWGLAIMDPTYYAQLCFDYIITSSFIAKRYEDPINRQRFPKSARFYEQLDSDSRFRKIYSLKPIAWQRPGPTIDIYKVVANCGER